VGGGDVRFKGKGNDGLHYGSNHKSPCPPAAWDVHSGRATDGFGECRGEGFALVVASGGRAVRNVGLRLVSRVVVRGVTSVDGCATQQGRSCLVV